MKFLNVLVVALLTLSLSAYGQHEEINHNQHESDAHFRVSVAIAHTFLPEETAEGTKNLILPTFALDIEYWINHYWVQIRMQRYKVVKVYARNYK